MKTYRPRKLSRAQLEELNGSLSSEAAVLSMALADVATGKFPITWFAAGEMKVGVSRELAGHGGLVTVCDNGTVRAYYFEEWFALYRFARDTETLRMISDLSYQVANHVRYVQDKYVSSVAAIIPSLVKTA